MTKVQAVIWGAGETLDGFLGLAKAQWRVSWECEKVGGGFSCVSLTVSGGLPEVSWWAGWSVGQSVRGFFWVSLTVVGQPKKPSPPVADCIQRRFMGLMKGLWQGSMCTTPPNMPHVAQGAHGKGHMFAQGSVPTPAMHTKQGEQH